MNSNLVNHFKTVFGTMRPNFLLLSMVVVLLGTALGLYDGAEWSGTLFTLLMLGGVLAHASVNMLNEYQDYQTGLDDLTERTPFSGGSGSLQDNPQSAPYVLKTLVGFLLILIGVGLYFVALKGWMLLPIGVVGVLVIVTYTSTITRYPWLCLFAPGFAFGPLMVLGTYYVWTGSFAWSAFWLSMVPFFLVNNLLLLNQFPDLDADRKIGRYNILMLLGERSGARIFNGFLFLSFLMLVIAYFSSPLPNTILIALMAFVVAIPLYRGVSEHYARVDKLMPALAMNVIINLLTPLLMAGGLFWALI
ncbi:MAG: prenyltransferase [Thiotrichales bacterium]|nr:prenyltransferase [Thiotrichales bacterium]